MIKIENKIGNSQEIQDLMKLIEELKILRESQDNRKHDHIEDYMNDQRRNLYRHFSGSEKISLAKKAAAQMMDEIIEYYNDKRKNAQYTRKTSLYDLTNKLTININIDSFLEVVRKKFDEIKRELNEQDGVVIYQKLNHEDENPDLNSLVEIENLEKIIIIGELYDALIVQKLKFSERKFVYSVYEMFDKMLNFYQYVNQYAGPEILFKNIERSNIEPYKNDPENHLKHLKNKFQIRGKARNELLLKSYLSLREEGIGVTDYGSISIMPYDKKEVDGDFQRIESAVNRLKKDDGCVKDLSKTINMDYVEKFFEYDIKKYDESKLKKVEESMLPIMMKSILDYYEKEIKSELHKIISDKRYQDQDISSAILYLLKKDFSLFFEREEKDVSKIISIALFYDLLIIKKRFVDAEQFLGLSALFLQYHRDDRLTNYDEIYSNELERMISRIDLKSCLPFYDPRPDLVKVIHDHHAKFNIDHTVQWDYLHKFKESILGMNVFYSNLIFTDNLLGLYYKDVDINEKIRIAGANYDFSILLEPEFPIYKSDNHDYRFSSVSHPREKFTNYVIPHITSAICRLNILNRKIEQRRDLDEQQKEDFYRKNLHSYAKYLMMEGIYWNHSGRTKEQLQGDLNRDIEAEQAHKNEIIQREIERAANRERERMEAENRARMEAENRERERMEAENRARREVENRERIKAENRERMEAEYRERMEVENRERERMEAENRERERMEAENRKRIKAEKVRKIVNAVMYIPRKVMSILKGIWNGIGQLFSGLSALIKSALGIKRRDERALDSAKITRGDADIAGSTPPKF